MLASNPLLTQLERRTFVKCVDSKSTITTSYDDFSSFDSFRRVAADINRQPLLTQTCRNNENHLTEWHFRGDQRRAARVHSVENPRSDLGCMWASRPGAWGPRATPIQPSWMTN
jgi:hypothetical protein